MSSKASYTQQLQKVCSTAHEWEQELICSSCFIDLFYPGALNNTSKGFWRATNTEVPKWNSSFWQMVQVIRIFISARKQEYSGRFLEVFVIPRDRLNPCEFRDCLKKITKQPKRKVIEEGGEENVHFLFWMPIETGHWCGFGIVLLQWVTICRKLTFIPPAVTTLSIIHIQDRRRKDCETAAVWLKQN